MINTLEIKNFKSIKYLKTDCKRINIFIGKPNVGKSNILEALSLFSVPYSKNKDNYFKDLIRFKSLKNLFYDNISTNKIEVKTDVLNAVFVTENNRNYELLIGKDSNLITKHNEFGETYGQREEFADSNKIKYLLFSETGIGDFITKTSNYLSPIKKYIFNTDAELNNSFRDYLIPPNGENLITILQQNPELFSEVGEFFEEYNLELLYDLEKNLFEIQKKVDKIIYKYPYKLIADTLQRIIFYLAVVETNKNVSIVLEEPETHSYPPYIKLLAERISESKDNQFFIATHSPYLLNSIIENTPFDELNVFVTYFEDYQTKIKKLSDSDLGDILDNFTDAFFNLDKFIDDEQ